MIMYTDYRVLEKALFETDGLLYFHGPRVDVAPRTGLHTDHVDRCRGGYASFWKRMTVTDTLGDFMLRYNNLRNALSAC